MPLFTHHTENTIAVTCNACRQLLMSYFISGGWVLTLGIFTFQQTLVTFQCLTGTHDSIMLDGFWLQQHLKCENDL